MITFQHSDANHKFWMVESRENFPFGGDQRLEMGDTWVTLKLFIYLFIIDLQDSICFRCTAQLTNHRKLLYDIGYIPSAVHYIPVTYFIVIRF